MGFGQLIWNIMDICLCTVLNNWLMVCNIFITMKLIRNNTLNGENVLLFSYDKNI